MSLSFCTSLTHLFRKEKGWDAPCYPRWASNDAPGELLAGKSKWRPGPHSLGVG
jgi:hypothetical protein